MEYTEINTRKLVTINQVTSESLYFEFKRNFFKYSILLLKANTVNVMRINAQCIP